MDDVFYYKLSWYDDLDSHELLKNCTYSQLISMLSLHWKQCPGGHLNVRRKALEALVKYYSEPSLDKNPIKTGSELVIVGETIFKTKNLTERLGNFGVKLASKVTDSTTHVLLGVNPKTTKGLEKHSVTLLRDPDLQSELDRLEQPYLKEQDKETQNNVERIGDLLMSAQDENVELAVQIIEGGGFPNELIPHTFIAMKQTDNKKIRESLKIILSKHLTTNGKRAIQKTLLFHKHLTEAQLQKNLKKYTDNAPELNPLEIAEVMFKYHQKCVQYLFAFTKNKERICQIIEAFIKDKTLDFSNLGLSRLPKELEKYDQLEAIDLSFNRLTSIPTFLAKFQNLNYLNLMGNSIKTVNSAFFEMKNLQHLVLRCPIYNWSDWAKVAQLKKLKKLELSDYCLPDGADEMLQKELPNCEIIGH